MESYKIVPGMFTMKMNILIYGDPGMGKTFLAGTAQDSPSMANVHVFNIDGGLMTLAERGDIEATDIRSVEDLEREAFKIAGGDPKYADVRTVVIDNITELQTLSIEGIITADMKSRKGKSTIDDVYLEDYGKSSKQLARVLRMFRDLPLHVIYIAHKRDKLRKGTQILESTKPALTEKLCNSVMGYMDFVWYLYTADEVIAEGENTRTVMNRYLLTQPMNNYAAKTRGTAFADALGPVVVNPRLDEIMETYIALINPTTNN